MIIEKTYYLPNNDDLLHNIMILKVLAGKCLCHIKKERINADYSKVTLACTESLFADYEGLLTRGEGKKLWSMNIK